MRLSIELQKGTTCRYPHGHQSWNSQDCFVLTTQGNAQGRRSRAQTMLSRTIQGTPKELRLTIKTRPAHANRAICECQVWAKDQGLWSEPRGPNELEAKQGLPINSLEQSNPEWFVASPLAGLEVQG